MYAYVSEYIGGMGNQIFQFMNLMYVCHKYNRTPVFITQDRTPGYCTSPTYNHNLFKLKEVSQEYINTYPPPVIITSVEQFIEINYPDNIPENQNISLTGLRINIRNFKEIIPNALKYLNIPDNITRKDNICLVAFRYYIYENRQDWLVDPSYYTRAFKIMQERVPDIFFYAFTDESNYALDILNKNNITNYQLFVGAKDRYTEVEHLYKTFECNHSIMVESTYNLWSMILNTNPNHITCLPKHIVWIHRLNIYDITGEMIIC